MVSSCGPKIEIEDNFPFFSPFLSKASLTLWVKTQMGTQKKTEEEKQQIRLGGFFVPKKARHQRQKLFKI
jgi:hypothetical protein